MKELRFAIIGAGAIARSYEAAFRELKGAKVVAVSDEKLELTEILDKEKHRGNQASLELEKVVARYKAEVEKLQDLVLMMGNRHVQVQAQLQFLQQQALHFQQRPQQRLHGHGPLRRVDVGREQ